jgi:hypothetical protein
LPVHTRVLRSHTFAQLLKAEAIAAKL